MYFKITVTLTEFTVLLLGVPDNDIGVEGGSFSWYSTTNSLSSTGQTVSDNDSFSDRNLLIADDDDNNDASHDHHSFMSAVDHLALRNINLTVAKVRDRLL